jgi:hypothetical protein
MSEIKVNNISALDGSSSISVLDPILSNSVATFNKLYVTDYTSYVTSGKDQLTSKWYVDNQFDIRGIGATGISGLDTLTTQIAALKVDINASVATNYLPKVGFGAHSGGGITFGGSRYVFGNSTVMDINTAGKIGIGGTADTSNALQLMGVFGFANSVATKTASSIISQDSGNRLTINSYNDLIMQSGSVQKLKLGGTDQEMAGNLKLTTGGGYLSAAYTSNDSYRALLGWSSLQLGNNGPNRIVAGNTNVNGSLEFWVNNKKDITSHGVTSDGIQAMTLASSGFVGVGVANPSQKLSVLNGAIRVDNTASTGLLTLILSGNGSNLQVGHSGGNICSITNSGTDYGGFEFKGNLGTTLRLAGDGRVGIGTTNPFYSLSVAAANGNTMEFGPEYASGANLLQCYNRTTGVYTNLTTSANSYAIFTGGTQKITITPEGKVGIGTATPNSVLDVEDNTSSASGFDHHKVFKTVHLKTESYSKVYVKLFVIPFNTTAASSAEDLNWGVGGFNISGTITTQRSNNFGVSCSQVIEAGTSWVSYYGHPSGYTAASTATLEGACKFSSIGFTEYPSAGAGGTNEPFELVQVDIGGVKWACLYRNQQGIAGAQSITFDGVVTGLTRAPSKHLFGLTDTDAVLVVTTNGDNAAPGGSGAITDRHTALAYTRKVVDFGGSRLNCYRTPTSGKDLVNKDYVDGLGQTWQDQVVISRYFAFDYGFINNTSRPIQVRWAFSHSSASTRIRSYVSKPSGGYVQVYESYDDGARAHTHCFLVPPGENYYVSKISGTTPSTPLFWSEFR